MLVVLCMLVCVSVSGQDHASVECLETVNQEGSQETTSCKCYRSSARNCALVKTSTINKQSITVCHKRHTSNSCVFRSITIFKWLPGTETVILHISVLSSLTYNTGAYYCLEITWWFYWTFQKPCQIFYWSCIKLLAHLSHFTSEFRVYFLAQSSFSLPLLTYLAVQVQGWISCSVCHHTGVEYKF